jgi:hypothetical protein
MYEADLSVSVVLNIDFFTVTVSYNLVTEKLLKGMFKSSLKKYYIRHHELIGRTKY